MAKDVPINFKTSQEVVVLINKYLELNVGLTQSDLIRDALSEFFEKRDMDFLNKEITKHKNIIKKLEDNKKVLKLTQSTKKEISDKEREFLVETNQKIEQNPKFLQGRFESYQTIFKKPTLKKDEFVKLLEKVK